MNLPSNTLQKLGKFLESRTGKAIGDYAMIADGDTVLVCVSGGKDSYTLLHLLLTLQKRAPIKFRLIAMNLDQKQPGFPAEVLPRYFESIGVDYRIVEADTYSVVKEKIPAGKTTCSLCSRLRRGNLYRIAREEGCSAVVLGHHRDDMLETFFMNLFHGGRLATMPPKLLNEDGDLFVYRPLAFVAEADCEKFARAMNYPIIPCDLCGSQEGLQRAQVKKLLDEWESRTPGRRQVMFRALMNTRPSHLLDTALFDFAGLTPSAAAKSAAPGDVPDLRDTRRD